MFYSSKKITALFQKEKHRLWSNRAAKNIKMKRGVKPPRARTMKVYQTLKTLIVCVRACVCVREFDTECMRFNGTCV